MSDSHGAQKSYAKKNEEIRSGDLSCLSRPYDRTRHIMWATNIDSSVKLVLLAIVDHVNDSDGMATMGIDRLSRMTGLSRRPVERAILRAESEGIISVARFTGGTSAYRIEWSMLTGQEVNCRKSKKLDAPQSIAREDVAEVQPGKTATVIRPKMDEADNLDWN